MAGVAAEPLIVRAAGIVKQRFPLPRQRWMFGTPQPTGPHDAPSTDIDDLQLITQIIGDHGLLAVRKESQSERPALQRKPPQFAVVLRQTVFDEIAGITAGPRQRRPRIQRQAREPAICHPALVDVLARYGKGTLDDMSKDQRLAVRREGEAAQVEGIFTLSRPDQFAGGRVPEPHLRRTTAGGSDKSAIGWQ